MADMAIKTMRFRTADGNIVERQVAEGRLHAAGESAPDWVVLAEPTDMRLLGARTLEGMNLRVDLLARQLVPAGPMPAAASSSMTPGRTRVASACPTRTATRRRGSPRR